MDPEKRLEAFEKMLSAIESHYAGIVSRMETESPGQGEKRHISPAHGE